MSSVSPERDTRDTREGLTGGLTSCNVRFIWSWLMFVAR